MTPLVFVHGFMGGAAQWAGQVAVFGDRPVVAIDLPGFGDRADEAVPNTIPGFAEAALAEIDRRGIGAFDLVGHSMGGMIVQEMAVRAAGRLGRLVLYGTGPTGALENRFESFEASKARASADGALATARRIAANWFADGAEATGYAGCAAIAELASLAAMHAGFDAMAAWRGIGGLDRIACPTLVLWGERDRSYGWRETEALWRGIPGAALAVVPGAGHAVHLEDEPLFNLLLARFLVANG
ncbi:MAG: alpha/beta fold hydrolase [Pseudomonadota bacterium]